MASQVLSGSSNPSYTNNTGQNVRIVINFMSSSSTASPFTGNPNEIAISWAGVSVTSRLKSIGRNLAFVSITGSTNPLSVYANNAQVGESISSQTLSGLPTELMLAPGQTFNAFCGAYNIVVIPEAG